MALYLTGGGDQEDFYKLDEHFLNSLDHGSKLLLIPQALDEDEYDDALERIEECFKHKKVSTIDLALHPQDMSWSELSSYDVVVIEGGNTFQLIRAIRDSAFFTLLKKFYQSGKTIYADSAGAILLGNDVQTAFLGDDGDEDHLKLQDYRGLDLINGWSIHAHYEHSDESGLQDLLYDKASPIIALPEPGGVVITQNKIISLGSNPIDLITFAGKITIRPGDQQNLDELG